MATLMTQQIGRDPARRCDATCHNAKKPKCVCICGGRYHGKKSGSAELAAAVKEFTVRVLGPELSKQMGMVYGDDSTTPAR